MSLAITQTRAMLVDAYRELNARKLFWITLILSGVLVLVFALLDIGNGSITFAGFSIDIPVDPDRKLFFNLAFTQIGIGVWLTWVATVLALISTAGIVPDLVSSGTVEMLVSKPISRVRLLLTKYAFGLLFVALQVAVFSVGSFLVFGLKGVMWEPRILLAIPIVVAFYSYLFSVCMLLGLLTKSTVAALLTTLLFWFAMFILNFTDASLLTMKSSSELRVDGLRADVTRLEALTIEGLEAQGDDAPDANDTEALDDSNFYLASRRRNLAAAEEEYESWAKWSGRVAIAKTVLPKTSETIALLERSLIDMTEIEGLQQGGPDWEDEARAAAEERGDVYVSQREASAAAESALRDRSIWWVLGTSLTFEGVVLAICCWRFTKRDF